METNSNHAKFRISDTELEISGPVDFVREQVQNSKNVIEFFAESIKYKIANPSRAIPDKVDAALLGLLPQDTDNGLVKRQEEYADFVEVKDAENLITKYSNVLAKNGDKLQVIATIPGNSQTSRMVNLVLIYLFAKQKLYSIDKVSFGELRAVCEMHGELDARHFSDYIKKNKKWFLIDGSGKSMSAIITVPGAKEAVRFLDSMNN